MHHHRIVLCVATSALLAGIGLALSCAHDNPFADAGNARAHVSDRSFGTLDEGDSVEIFHSESLTVVVAGREMVDSFSVTIPGNRFGAVQMLRASEERGFGDRLFLMRFSLSDTGIVRAAVSTYRSNGDLVVDAFSLRAISPLHQDTVRALLGVPVTLACTPVRDGDLLYHWSMGSSVQVFAASPQTATTIGGAVAYEGHGELWVSDVRSQYSSPRVPFFFTIDDTAGPDIDAVSGNDTSVTSDSVFVLAVRVIDQGVGLQGSPTVNGVPMTASGSGAYYAGVHGVDSLAADMAIALVVVAVDRYGHWSRHTFFVMYDPAGAHGTSLSLEILAPNPDTSFTSSAIILVAGRVVNITRDSLRVRVSVSVNGMTAAAPRTVARSGGAFEIDALLSADTNLVAVDAFDSVGNVHVTASRVIIVDASVVDTLPPVIARISIDGLAADQLFVDRRSVRIAVLAFDQGSGLDSVTINGLRAATIDSTGAYVWYATTMLDHVPQGNAVRVMAFDRSGNQTVSTAVVYRNDAPYLVRRLQPSATIRVGSTFGDSLRAVDSDGDSLVLTLVAGPAGLVLDNRAISWTPSDTGRTTVVVSIDDGYQPVWVAETLLVIDAENQPCSLSVRSVRGRLSGDILQLDDTVAADTLRYSIADADVPGTDRYQLCLAQGNKTLVKSLDTARTFPVVVERASMPASGMRLVAVVTDGALHRDTVSLWVVGARFARPLLGARRLWLNTAATGADIADGVADFPLLVRLTAATFSFAAADSGGLVFETSMGTPLPYEVERWDRTSRVAELWVLVDTVYAGRTAQYIRMGVDTSLRQNASQPTRVFDTANGFEGVWHLGTLLSDATAHGYTGINLGTTVVSGVVVDGRQFNGTTAHIDIGSNLPILSGAAGASLSAWVNVTRAAGSGYSSIVAVSVGSQTATSASRAQLSVDSLLRPWVFARGSDTTRIGGAAGGTSGLQLGVWHHVAASVRYDTDSLFVFLDGRRIDARQWSFGSERTPATPAYAVRLGVDDQGSLERLAGNLDEVRISRTARSDAWMRLSYETQRPGSTVVTITPE